MTPSIAIERTHVHDDAAAGSKNKTIVNNAPHLGMFWFAGWLFTIGFLKLIWWKAILGLLIWPYFVGAYFAR